MQASTGASVGSNSRSSQARIAPRHEANAI